MPSRTQKTTEKPALAARRIGVTEAVEVGGNDRELLKLLLLLLRSAPCRS